MMIINEDELFKNKKIDDNLNKFIRESTEIIPINEVYFGETVKIKELLDCIHKFRIKYLDKSLKDLNNIKFSSNSDLKQFNKICASYFGFKAFGLQIEKYNFINAWTYPIAGKIDVSVVDRNKVAILTPNGYKFINNSYVCTVHITTKLIFSKEYTDRDIMAVILHEIGHNFSYILNKGQTIFSNMIAYSNTNNLIHGLIKVWIIDKKDAKEYSETIYNSEDNLINNLANHIEKQDNTFINMMSIIMKPVAFLYTIGMIIKDIYSIPFKIIYNLFLKYICNLNPISVLVNVFGYKDEKIADNFATMYGFGKENIKFEKTVYKMTHKNKPDFFINLMSTVLFPVYLSMNLSDPHPELVSRCLDQINLLEEELEKEDIDEDVKKEIKLNLKDAQIEYKKLENNMDKYDANGAKIYRKLMSRLFGGDFRELFVNSKKIHSKYDNVKKE